jgi:GT2 family glycosyltransferase
MIDVIVPVFKGVDVTRECVRRLLSFQQKTDFEIVLVDDAAPECPEAFLLTHPEASELTQGWASLLTHP